MGHSFRLQRKISSQFPLQIAELTPAEEIREKVACSVLLECNA